MVLCVRYARLTQKAALFLVAALAASPQVGLVRPLPIKTMSAEPSEEGQRLLGRSAPEWTGIQWIQGGPLALRDLRGKVVLLRFWLMSCPFCRRTAPALAELWERYRARGLVVVGLHHPISEASSDPGDVAAAVAKFGWTFPIGIDSSWSTVRNYGYETEFSRFSSMSFLIDQQGVIRFVHEGGEFHPGGGSEHQRCNKVYESLIVAIENALGSTKKQSGAVEHDR